MSPSLQEAPSELGSFGKLRLGLDEHGRLVAIKEVCSRWRERIYRLLGKVPPEPSRYFTEAPEFIFELACQSTCSTQFSLFELARAHGKIWAMVEPFPAGSLARPRAINLDLLDVFLLSVLKDVGLALKRAHQLNLVHRDLRLSNVLVHKNGFVLCDFGSVYATNDPRWQIGRVASNPAPEQFISDLRLDERADVFALGRMVLDLLPFEGKGLMPGFELSNEPLSYFEQLEQWRKVCYGDSGAHHAKDFLLNAPLLTQYFNQYCTMAMGLAPVATDLILRHLLVYDPNERARDGGAVSELAEMALNRFLSPKRAALAQFLESWHQSPSPSWSFWQERLYAVAPQWRLSLMLHDEPSDAIDRLNITEARQDD